VTKIHHPTKNIGLLDVANLVIFHSKKWRKKSLRKITKWGGGGGGGELFFLFANFFVVFFISVL